jgi:hypothetical protein
VGCYNNNSPGTFRYHLVHSEGQAPQYMGTFLRSRDHIPPSGRNNNSLITRCCVAGRLTYLLRGLSPQANYTDRHLSAKLVPTFADRGCHVVSVTDPYGHILGFLDRTCCVNPIDNTNYAPITTTQYTRTKHFTRTLAQSTSPEHSHKALH